MQDAVQRLPTSTVKSGATRAVDANEAYTLAWFGDQEGRSGVKRPLETPLPWVAANIKARDL